MNDRAQGRSPIEGRQELVPARAQKEIHERLAESDVEFVRVLEDLIATLIEKRVILLTDLPVAAQQKLAARRDMRHRLASLEDIVADGDDVMLP